MSRARNQPDQGELGDEVLMERYVRGDGAAFEELFRRYEPVAYGFFVRRTGSPERAHDLYQELFLRIHRARESYDANRAFTPWFFRIAHRLLLDDRRRAWRAREVPVHDSELGAEGRDSERQLADRERADRVLGALSVEERYVLVKAKVEGTPYLEIALELGKSVAAVKKLASRAMQRLREAGEAQPGLPVR